MALLLGGHAFDAFEIVLRDKPTALMQASPKATVPVLVLDDQTVIDQSWAIMRWALSVPPPQPPASNLQRWWTLGQSEQAQELLQRNDGAFKHHLDRYKYPQRVEGSEDRTPQDIAYEHRQGALDVLLFPLEKALSAHAFLTGDEPCAADIAIFPFVRQFAAVDPVWFHALPLPMTQAWLAHWMGSRLFQASMMKLPPNRRTPFLTSSPL
jgi:glutathione S-transferase